MSYIDIGNPWTEGRLPIAEREELMDEEYNYREEEAEDKRKFPDEE